MNELKEKDWEPASNLGATPAEALENVRKEMRLQQLREEFDAAQSLVEAFLDRDLPIDDEWFSLAYELVVPRDLAHRRYTIARDFNEFDPKRADMLWKLQQQ